MRVIDHRQFARARAVPRSRHWGRIVAWCIVSIAAALVIGNGVLWIMYRDRVMPHYYVGAAPVGGVRYDNLHTAVTANTVLLPTITVQLDGRTAAVMPAKSGISPDIPATTAALRAARPTLPMMSLFTRHTVPVQVHVDDNAFGTVAIGLQKTFAKQPVGNHVVYINGSFRAAPPEAGYALDVSRLKAVLAHAAALGQASVMAPTTTLPALADTAGVQAEVQKLQRQLTARISLSYGAKTGKINTDVMGRWYVADGNTMTASRERIAQDVASFAKDASVTPANADDAVTAVVYALTKNQTLDFRLVASSATPIYRYCVAQRGLDDSVLEPLRLKLAATYGDGRGWNDKGRIGFVYSEAGCQLHVWLAAPSAMASFGSICDDYYSCTVFPNVVINNDRWVGATEPWNAQHLSLEEYDAMVINHESGHWLGFDHVTCPAAGQPAPVMMQQSVQLGGCTFNAWPLASEAAAAAR